MTHQFEISCYCARNTWLQMAYTSLKNWMRKINQEKLTHQDKNCN